MEDKMREEIFRFVYKMAFQDAVRQRAYEGKKKDLCEMPGAKEAIKKYVDYIIKGQDLTQEEHEKIFKDVALELCKAVNKDSYTFGNAQKVINMTAKYLYIICYADSAFRERFKYCHCPMDRVMLNIVWKRYKEKYGVKVRKEKLNEGISEGDFLKSWGKENWENGEIPRRYINFQKAVQELAGELYPVEYDYYNFD